MLTKKKVIMPFIIIVAILLIGVIIFKLTARDTAPVDSVSLTPTSPSPESTPENNDLWQTSVNQEQELEFKYPAKLIAKYISLVEWPPVLEVQAGQNLDCSETPAESSLPKRVTSRQVDNRIYCVEASSEGAAGSVYTEYSYSGVWKEKIVKFSFTLRYPQCNNYSEPQQTECGNEREAFDLDGVVDRMFSSLKDLNNTKE